MRNLPQRTHQVDHRITQLAANNQFAALRQRIHLVDHRITQLAKYRNLLIQSTTSPTQQIEPHQFQVGDLVIYPNISWQRLPDGSAECQYAECTIVSIDNHTPPNPHKYCLKYDQGYHYCDNLNEWN